jgi:hypothetical protein
MTVSSCGNHSGSGCRTEGTGPRIAPEVRRSCSPHFGTRSEEPLSYASEDEREGKVVVISMHGRRRLSRPLPP